MNTKANKGANHHDPKSNPNKRRKMSNDCANDDEEKNIINDNPNPTLNHLSALRLIMVEAGKIIGFMTAQDLHNYLITCKDIHHYKKSAWKHWLTNVNETNRRLNGASTKMVNLYNSINNCFMNACYQALHHISLLCPNFQPETRQDNQYGTRPQMYLNEIMNGLSSDPSSPQHEEKQKQAKKAGEDMRELLRANNVNYGNGEQHDACGYLEYLIHLCYPTTNVFGKRIPMIVGGQYFIENECIPQQHLLASSFTPFIALFIPTFCEKSTNEKRRIQFLIDYFFKFSNENIVQGKCSQCLQHTELLARTRIYHLPSILILNISKTLGKVHVDPRIRVPNVDDSNNKSFTVYHLFAFIVHAGQNLASGHYYIVCKSEPNHIYKVFDDLDKTKIITNKKSLEELQQLPPDHSPVVAFYKKGRTVINNDFHEEAEDETPETMSKDLIMTTTKTKITEKTLVTNDSIMINPIQWMNVNDTTIECFGYPTYNKTLIDYPTVWNQNAKLGVTKKNSIKTPNLSRKLNGKKIITIQQETGCIIIVDSLFIYMIQDNGIWTKIVHDINDLLRATVSVKATEKCIYIGKVNEGYIIKLNIEKNAVTQRCCLYDNERRMAVSDFIIHGEFIIEIQSKYVLMYKEINGELKWETGFSYPRLDEKPDYNDVIQNINIAEDFWDREILEREIDDKVYLYFATCSDKLQTTKHYPKQQSNNRNWLYFNNKGTVIALHPLNKKIEIVDEGSNITMTAISNKYGVFGIIDNQILAQYASFDHGPNEILNVNSEIIKSMFNEEVIEFEFILYDETYGISGQLIVFVKTKKGDFSYFKLFNLEEYETVKQYLIDYLNFSEIAKTILASLYSNYF